MRAALEAANRIDIYYYNFSYTYWRFYNNLAHFLEGNTNMELRGTTFFPGRVSAGGWGGH